MADSNIIHEFGDFNLDTAAKVLRRGGEVVPLPMKSVELLCLLVENRGDVVSKDRIFESVWANTFVEDSVLTQNIYRLRKTFEEFGLTDVIETVPRRGYLFKIPGQPSGAVVIEREVVDEIEIVEEVTDEEPRPFLRHSKRNAAVAAVLLVLTVITVSGFWVWRSEHPVKKMSDLRSIAVLPIRPLIESENEKILANGIREKIVASLSELKRIKMQSVDAGETEIGGLTSFDAVMTGTIQRSNEKVRVTLRLIGTADSEQFWTGSFDEPEIELFTLQDKIAEEITKSLSMNLSARDRSIVFRRGTASKDAYDSFLQGRYFFNQRGDDYTHSISKAIGHFERAIELDPAFADAYAGLAMALNLEIDSEARLDDSPAEMYKRSNDLISKALAIDPNLAEAHAAKAMIESRFEWKFEAAERSYNKALEINPNLPNVYIWLSTVAHFQQRSDQAVRYAEKAVELEPTFSKALGNLAMAYAYNGDCDKAVALFPRIAQYMTHEGNRLELESSVVSICGRCTENAEIIQMAKEVLPKGRIVASNYAYCLALNGDKAGATIELELIKSTKLNGNSVVAQMIVLNAIGERDKAVALFTEQYRFRNSRLLKILYDPRLKELKADRRIAELTKDIN